MSHLILPNSSPAPYIQTQPTPQRLDPAALKMKERTVLVDASLDDGGWRMKPPFDELHKALLFAIVQNNAEFKSKGVFFDPHLSGARQQKQFDVGVFDTRFDTFRAVVNWTKEKHGSIPRAHILVAYDDTTIGIISPYRTTRICFKCDLEGYRDEAKTQPWVVPNKGCPRCTMLDWWGHKPHPGTGRIIASKLDVLEKAAEVVDRTASGTRYNNDFLYRSFGGARAAAKKKALSRPPS